MGPLLVSLVLLAAAMLYDSRLLLAAAAGLVVFCYVLALGESRAQKGGGSGRSR